MKIFIIPGHGAGDPGACGNGYQEAERVRKLAQRIKDLGGDNVILADFKRNYYADNGISKLTLDKDTQIVELHMDSATASARGGHVIINAKYNADKYDKAIADGIAKLLPGRAEKISKRNDLANLKRAAAKGYSYRLVECGFITNKEDVKIFNTKMDEIAKIILNAFGVKVNTSAVKEVQENKAKISEQIKIIQQALNNLKKINKQVKIDAQISLAQQAVDNMTKLNGK